MSNILKATALQMYEDGISKRAISVELGVPRSTVQDWVRGVEFDEVPLSESAIPKLHEATAQETLDDLRAMAEANPEKVIGRNYYRINGKYSESAWNQYWGTFHEFKRQAGIILTRQQHNIEKQIAKHASVDHYRTLSDELKSYGNKYDKPSSGRYKQAVIIGDLHDKNVDPFYMKVVIDTCLRVQPDVIVINGDGVDLPEFGKYNVDVRDYDVVGRLKFFHKEILEPLRNACPNATIDYIAGNHENRLLAHMADSTPALRVVLSDLHGMTVGSLLGLDKYQVNFISKGDLSAYTLTDKHKEIAKSYKKYWNSFICHHFSEGSSLGFPGCNGHNHKTVVTPQYNETFGAYSWVQHGCGHKLDAEYCHPKWQLGFVIANVDTEKCSTVFDVITFSEDMAVVGGKVYTR